MSEPARQPSITPFDPIDPKVMECPYPHFRSIQEEGAVHRVPNADYYIVSRFDEVREVLQRHRDFSSDLTPLFDGMGVGSPFVPAPVLNLSDPPVHTRTKPIAVRAFGPGRIKIIEPKIHAIVDELIDGFIAKGEVELLQEFALPLPMRIIAGELGIPASDLDRFKHWSDQMLKFNNPGSTADEVSYAKEAITEANVYFREKFLSKREVPEDDVMSLLATAETAVSEDDQAHERPRPLTDDEALSIIQLILVGGNETTTNAIVNGMLLLQQNPEVTAQLRAGTADWDNVIEECLRLESPVRGFWRFAAHDTELGGIAIPKGTMLFLSYAAANRDPRHFERPDCLDPARANSKAHLAFGQGIHICVGFRLARKEIEIALKRLYARLDNIQLAPGRNDMENMFIPTALVRGVKALHLTFDKV